MDLSLSLDSLLTTGGRVTVLMDETERRELTSVTQPNSLSLIHLHMLSASPSLKFYKGRIPWRNLVSF